MHDLYTFECRTGPLPDDERWTLRFGGPAAYERALAHAAIRQITHACMRVIDGASLKTLLGLQKSWRARLRAIA